MLYIGASHESLGWSWVFIKLWKSSSDCLLSEIISADRAVRRSDFHQSSFTPCVCCVVAWKSGQVYDECLKIGALPSIARANLSGWIRVGQWQSIELEAVTTLQWRLLPSNWLLGLAKRYWTHFCHGWSMDLHFYSVRPSEVMWLMLTRLSCGELLRHWQVVEWDQLPIRFIVGGSGMDRDPWSIRVLKRIERIRQVERKGGIKFGKGGNRFISWSSAHVFPMRSPESSV